MISTTKKQKKHIKPSWDEYFMNLAEAVGARATCDRGRTGCIVARDKRILATGYVGSPAGLPHCDDVGHEFHTVIHKDGTQTQHCIRTSHAEANAIVHASRVGVPLDKSTLYSHMVPCYMCAKMIINAGIIRVVCLKDYHASVQTKKAFKQAKIKLEIVSGKMETYENS